MARPLPDIHAVGAEGYYPKGSVWRDAWKCYWRVVNWRSGGVVTEGITRSGKKNGRMAIHCHGELKPGRLAKKAKLRSSP